MANIPLAVGDWRRDIPGAPDIALVNRYFEQTPDPEHGPVSLIARPGLRRFLTIGDGPIRGVYTQPGTFSDALFAVSGDDLFKVTTAGVSSNLGALSAGSLDAVSMAATPNLDPTPEYLFLADGGTLYVYDGATIATVATPDSVAIISVGFIAGYIICVCAPAPGVNGRFYWIEPGAITIDPLNFATAERAPDPLYAVRIVGDQAWFLGSSSTEPWFLTGNDAAPFQRVQARIFDRGVWEGTDALVRDTIVLVDATDGTVYAVTGAGPQRISNHSIEERIRRGMVEQKEAGNG